MDNTSTDIKNFKNTNVVTFGCRLNIFESEIIRDNIAKAGLDNVVVFNTCTVTKAAEKEALQAIKKTKRDNPHLKIIVTGCAAQNNHNIFASMQEVDKIIGNNEKLSYKYYTFDEHRIVVDDIMSIKETANHLVSNFDGKARAFIEIQNGCDHRCTFCIIPFVRGNNRSVPIGVIVEQIQKLVTAGYNEVVFTGVDISGYGADLPGSPTLGQMIKRVLNLVPNLKRLRLSSIDVAEIDDELLELITYEKRIMPHIHISIQAGDNMILKRMKRRHNREQVIKFCNNLKSKRNDIAFGADIIAGFPTETDEMFLNTYNLILEANLQYLHIFPYSIRPNTPAARMPQVKTNIIKQRAKILRELGQVQLKKFLEDNLQKEYNIVYQNNGVSYTENFIPVKIHHKNSNENISYNVGSIIPVRLKYIENSYMLGEVIK